MPVSDAEFNALKRKHRRLSQRVRKLARVLEALSANGILPRSAAIILRERRQELEMPEDPSS